MTEEIIVDGVNVWECTYSKIGIDKKCYCEEDLYDDGTPVYECLERTECTYKQLKRLEQENNTICYNLHLAEQENKELKKQIESQKGLITVGGKAQYEMTLAYDKCKSALEEIREYCDRIERGEVIGTQDCLINSINEALNEDTAN